MSPEYGANLHFSHLKPGGWAEWQEKHPFFLSDDGTLEPESGVAKWTRMFFEAGEKMGTSPTSSRFLKGWMEDAGFVDVKEHILKLPVGTWPKDRRKKMIGAWQQVNMVEGTPALSLRLFTKTFGLSREETELTLIDVRNSVNNRNIHSYYHL